MYLEISDDQQYDTIIIISDEQQYDTMIIIFIMKTAKMIYYENLLQKQYLRGAYKTKIKLHR